MANLSLKQKAFVENYLVHFNAGRAAKEAGYSEKSCASQGWQLLNSPEIKVEVNKMVDQFGSNRAVLKGRIVEELCAIAFGDRYRVQERMRALELLGKHLALFRQDLDSYINIEPIIIQRRDGSEIELGVRRN